MLSSIVNVDAVVNVDAAVFVAFVGDSGSKSFMS